MAAIPPVYVSAAEDMAAARCALLLAPAGPIAPIVGRKKPIEHAHLLHELKAWMDKATADLQIFRPRLHLCVDRAPSCECTAHAEAEQSLWLCNLDGEPWASRWTMAKRWAELERAAPGMAATALDAITRASRAGLPVYTPAMCLAYCSWIHWQGEVDEKYAIADWEQAEVNKAEEDGFPTRAYMERGLPPITKAHSRRISHTRLAQTWGGAREVARAILELAEAVRANRPPKGATAMHTEQDDYVCLGYGATLRWNEEDPMGRIYDDYANGMYESHHVEEHYGWYPIANPGKQLHRVLEAVQRRFNVARAIEKLLVLIAERA